MIDHNEPADRKEARIYLRAQQAMVTDLLLMIVEHDLNSFSQLKGLIDIKAVAREAGSRSKVAVLANSENIDPIGSCVGQRGSRIQTIIQELGGEKIDIIEFSDDLSEFIANALAPAKILEVELEAEEQTVQQPLG